MPGEPPMQGRGSRLRRGRRRDGDPAPARRSGRPATSRWPASRRCASAGRPTCTPPPHNVFELRGIVKLARARALPYTLLGRGSDVVISDAGVRGLVVHVRAEGHEIADGRLVAEAGLPMAKAATVTAGQGSPGSSSASRSPATSGAPCGPTPGPTPRTWRRSSSRRSSCRPTEARRALDAAGLGLAYRDSRLKHPPPGAPAEVVLAATFRLAPADPTDLRTRLEEIRRWRREHQPLGIPSAGSVFRNPAEGPSAGALIDGCGLKGRRIGGAVVSRDARELDPQRPGRDGGRRAPPRRARAGDGRAGDGRPARLRGRLPGRLVGWVEESA